MILLLILAFSVAGCVRREREPVSGESAVRVTPRDAESETPAVPMRLTDEGAARAEAESDEAPPVQSAERATPTAPPPAAPPSVPSHRPADPKDTAFAEVRFRFGATYPYDAELGPLQHTFIGTISDRSAYAAARAFLAALLDGELPEDTLDDSLGRGARAILEELMWKGSDLADVRIGEVYQLSDVDVSLPFRLLGDQDEAIGELVLTNEDGRWYTSDIQVEYRSRGSDRRFDPASTSGRARR